MRRSAFGREWVGAGLLGALAGAALLAGCDESLLPGPDRESPKAEVVAPSGGSLIDPGAPLSVEAHVSDDQGVKTVTLSVIGNDGKPLFVGETVEFGTDRAAPRRAEVVRVLQPVAGAAPSEQARVIATVTDFSDRSSADTVLVAVRTEDEPGGNVEPVGAGVRFSITAPARVELTDTFTVSVAANAKAGVREVGVTLLAILRGSATPDTLSVQTQRVSGSAAAVRFAVDQLDLPRVQSLLAARDSVGLTLEINAFAVDANGTCASASVPDSVQTLACRPGAGGATFAPAAGARQAMLITRGRTVRLIGAGERLADLAWAGGRLFASNQTKNVLEVLNPGELRFNPTSRIAVGSEPWGLALGTDGGTLFVANSGGTNISAVSLGALRETGRIQTPNVMLFDVTFSIDSVDVGGGVKEQHEVPSAAVWYDYSDRPQFIAQTMSGELLVSTKPTGTAPDGTIRRVTRPAGNNGIADTEVFVDYAIARLFGKLGIVNADSVFVTRAEPKRLVVFPRKRTCTHADTAVVGFIDQLPAILAANGCDTKFFYGLDVAAVGLADTTFVAVSGNRRSVAFGEGARNVGRVMLFEDRGGRIDATSSNVRDLTLNAAERVTGLGLNSDGSLGVARGAQGYFFNDDLRLQGVVNAGAPTGGVAMHPSQSGIDGLAFVSGVDTASGVPFVDVVNVRNFARIRRIILRDAVIGSLIAVSGVDAGAQVTLYGITANGVVKIDLSGSDLAGS